MPNPSQPISVVCSNGKSHRTKKEIASRESAEAALSTGCAFRVRDEVRKNPVAYKEFKRINKLLSIINKNDALIEGSVNRYCQITAELAEFEAKKDEFSLGIKQLTEAYEADMEAHPDIDDRIIPTVEYFSTLAKMEASLINIDKQIMSKRKMLLDLEKENIMTIAAQLRSIPKKAEDTEEDDPMANLFGQRGAG